VRVFYVRPRCAAGYGSGRGTSYDEAWNGFESVDWQALAGAPATLFVATDPERPGAFVSLHVAWPLSRPAARAIGQFATA
jgi:hypothetical protein